VLNLIVQLILDAAILALMFKRGMKKLALPYLLTLGFLMPVALGKSLQFSTCFYAFSLGVLLLLLFKDKWNKRRVCFLFLGLGIFTAFVDFLTYPVAAFGIPAVVWLCMCPAETGKEGAKGLLDLLFSWGLGYGGMWAGKWVIMALTGYAEETKWALESIFIRSNSSELGRFSAVGRNLQVLMRKPFKLLALGAAAVAAVVFIRGMLSKESRFVPASPMLWISLLGLAVLPFAWYAAMVNSNHVHYFFMHRSLSITVFAGLCLLTRVLKRADGRSWFTLPPTELK